MKKWSLDLLMRFNLLSKQFKVSIKCTSPSSPSSITPLSYMLFSLNSYCSHSQVFLCVLNSLIFLWQSTVSKVIKRNEYISINKLGDLKKTYSTLFPCFDRKVCTWTVAAASSRSRKLLQYIQLLNVS